MRETNVPWLGETSTSRSSANRRIASRIGVRLTPTTADNSFSDTGVPGLICVVRIASRSFVYASSPKVIRGCRSRIDTV
jgi:hypothetical protein